VGIAHKEHAAYILRTPFAQERHGDTENGKRRNREKKEEEKERESDTSDCDTPVFLVHSDRENKMACSVKRFWFILTFLERQKTMYFSFSG